MIIKLAISNGDKSKNISTTPPPPPPPHTHTHTPPPCYGEKGVVVVCPCVHVYVRACVFVYICVYVCMRVCLVSGTVANLSNSIITVLVKIAAVPMMPWYVKFNYVQSCQTRLHHFRVQVCPVSFTMTFLFRFETDYCSSTD